MKQIIHSMAIFLGLLGVASTSSALPIGYGGRFVNSDGKPETGHIDLEVRFFSLGAGGVQLGPTIDFNNVELIQGVFQVTLDLPPADVATVFGVAGGSWIQIKDKTNNRILPRQQFLAVPYALRTPVDGSTIAYNDEGELQMGPDKPSAPSYLKMDAAGVLTWEAGGSATVAPDTVATSSIQDDAVTNSKIIDGAVDSDKILDGAVANIDIASLDATKLTGNIDYARLPVGTAVNTVAAGNDARFSDSRAPNGTAGGKLSGTYPNPTVNLAASDIPTLTAAKISDFNTAAAAQDTNAKTLCADGEFLRGEGATTCRTAAQIVADGAGLTTESDPQVGANTTNYVSKWDGSALVTGTILDNGTVANGAAAVAYTLNSSNSLTTAGAKSLSVQNAGSEVLGLKVGGAAFNPTNGYTLAVGNGSSDSHALKLGPVELGNLGANQLVLTSANLQLYNNTNTDGDTPTLYNNAYPVTIAGGNGTILPASTGVVLGTRANFTLAGSKIASFRNNNVEKSYVDKDGGAYFGSNVGIGTTNPGTKLSVVPTATNDGAHIARNGSGNGNGQWWGFIAQDAGATDAVVLGSSSSTHSTGGTLAWVGNSNGFLYYPNGGQFRIGTGIGATPSMVFNGSGEVGIGTVTPTAKLEIGGTAGVDGIKFPDGTLQTTAGAGVMTGAKYYLSTASVALTANTTVYNFNTQVYDTHNAVTTGASWKFTAPSAGYYEASVCVRGGNVGNGTIYLAVNGTPNTYLFTIPTDFLIRCGTTGVYLALNDYISFLSDNNVTVTGNSGNPKYTTVTITKVGK